MKSQIIAVLIAFFASLQGNPSAAVELSELHFSVPSKTVVSALKTPSNPTQMLQNIRALTLAHVLLRDDFYTKQVLSHALGGQKMDIHTDAKSKSKTVGLTGYDLIAKPTKVGDVEVPGVSIGIAKYVNKNGQTEAVLRLFVDRPGAFPPFEDVVNIFGKNWILMPKYPDAHAPAKSPTASYGARSIQYKGVDGPILYHTIIEFASDGTVAAITHTEIKG